MSMRAYYVPKQILDELANTRSQMMLYGVDPKSYHYVEYQKYDKDFEITFYLNGNRAWTVRFSSRDGD